MELKDFIKTAIEDVTCAVSELQGSLDNGAIINPVLKGSEASDNKTVLVNDERRMMANLNFDIAVTTTEADGVKGGARAGISIFGVGVGAEASTSAENVSRLTFSIPVVLPATNIDRRPGRPERKTIIEQ